MSRLSDAEVARIIDSPRCYDRDVRALAQELRERRANDRDLKAELDQARQPMSLSIDLDAVQSVLVAGVWYDVDDNSFVLDAYEYVWEGELVHGGGASGICAAGFRFTSGGPRISGPLTSIQAVSDKPMNRRPKKLRKP